MDTASGLHGKLRALRGLLRVAMASVGLGRFVCLTAALALADFALDRTFRFPHGLRLALLSAAGAVLLWQLGAQVGLPLLRAIPAGALALELERRLAAPADLFASALQFAAGGAGGTTSTALISATIEQAQAHAAAIRPAALVCWRPVKAWLVAAAAAAGVCAVTVALDPASAGFWLRRNVLLKAVEWPRRTRLTLLAAPRFVPRGEGAAISVKAEGVVPHAAQLQARGVETGAARTVVMQRTEQNVFAVSLPSLEETTACTVRAGDGALEGPVIEVVDRPAVARARMVITPPAYIGAQPVELAWNAPVFDVPTGSEATVSLEATKPLSSAVCRMAGGPVQTVEPMGGRAVSFDLPVSADVRCDVVLRDTLGIESAQPFPVEVRAVADRPPSLTLLASGVADMVVPDARIPLSVRATDDYGVVSAWLEQAHEGSDGRVDYLRVQLYQGAPQGEVGLEHVVDLKGRGLPPAGRLVLTAAAEDNCTVGGPNTGKSGPVRFRLVSVRELLAALLLRQEDLRRDLEQHIAREKDVRQRFDGAMGSAQRGGATVADLGASQRSLATALGLLSAQYRDVLGQMLNNRVIADVAYDSRLAGIVQPLERLAAADGPVLAAAGAMQRAVEAAAPQSAADSLLESALSDMQAVRDKMMLLESYAAVLASVQEIAGRQEQLLERTQEMQGPAAGGGS